MERNLVSGTEVEKTSTERFIEAGRKIDLLVDVVRAQSLLDELDGEHRIISPEVERSIKESVVNSAAFELYDRTRDHIEADVFFVDAVDLEQTFNQIVDKLPVAESA
ncbi:MAG TPA: hypothetical protein VLF39_03420 [Candidatus Saccharimonadales bacterium]|nr:hypothetical protein [Candidatus Saccharimonadales bacterium]